MKTTNKQLLDKQVEAYIIKNLSVAIEETQHRMKEVYNSNTKEAYKNKELHYYDVVLELLTEMYIIKH